MIVWQANLGRGVTVGEFERNLGRVLDAAGPRAVIAFQEIDEADTPDELGILLRRTGHTHTIVGSKTSVPILVPKHLRILEHQQTIACKGLAGFTPYRPVNEVVIRLGPNLTVAVLDVHIPLDRLQTMSRRREARNALRDRCLERRAQGHGGVWCADTNTRKGWPRIVPDEKTVTSAGIDKAKAWAPDGRRVIVTDRQTVRLTIDGHHAHGARVRFEAA